MPRTTGNIDIIPERDVTVMRDPTDVWLLNPGEDGELRQYEQWEQHRRFKAKAIFHGDKGDFYLKNSDDPFGVKVEDTDYPPVGEEELDMAPERPGQRYRLGHDETIWTVARAFKLSPTRLMDHNEITDPKTIRPGSWLYIPKPTVKDRPQVEYRPLKNPTWKHIDVPAGTTKWTFGAVKKQSDIKKDLKHYAHNQNVEIVGIAQVPVDGVTLAFYMDKHDFGNYVDTGRPAYTRGFNWQHLKEGRVAPEPKTSPLKDIIADAMAEDNRPAAAPEPASEAEVDEPAVITPETVEAAIQDEDIVPDTSYKDTFRYLNVEESPERYRLLESMDIRELDGALPPRHMKEGSLVMVSGWFEHEGTPYYRVATRYWYAIPTQFATSVENEAFAVDMTLSERVKYGGYLTSEERRMVMFARAAAKYNKFRTLTGLLRRK